MLLNQLRSRMKHAGIDRFFAWWQRELSSLLPAWARAPGDRQKSLALLEFDHTVSTIKLHEQGQWTEVARLDVGENITVAEQKAFFLAHLKRLGKKPDETGLLLSASQVLIKRLKMPLAVEENIRQVLGFEMDRYTPFKAEQVYFDFRITGRDAGQLDVQIAVAPRQKVDDLLKIALAWEANIQGVWLADELSNEGAKANLLPLSQRHREPSQFSRIDLAMAGVVTLLALSVSIFPVWQKRDLAIRLLPEVDRAHQQADAAEKLRVQFEGLQDEYEYILTKKREHPPVIAVLEDLTKILPDDTWVQQLDLKGKELQLQGETGASARLVGLFEQSRTLHGANYRAPLTKGQSGSGERFQIAVETKPLSLAETTWQAPVMQPASPVSEPPADTNKAVQPAEVQTIPKLDGLKPNSAPPAPVPPGAGSKS